MRRNGPWRFGRNWPTATPAILRFQSDLAVSHQMIGYELQLAGKPALALTAYERALAIRQKLADANPNVTDFQSNLSSTHQVMGWALNQSGKPVEALAVLERAITIMQKLADANPNVTEWQTELANDLRVHGRNTRQGRPNRGSSCRRTPGRRNS